MEFEDRTFKAETLRLDFCNFRKCKFDGCTMVYGGYGPVALINCSFSDTKWKFVDAAANTVGFMKGIYHGAGAGGRQLIDHTIEGIKQPPPPNPSNN
jgi:hypothetical protein